ncbi:hypothetical protein FRC02_004685 [Tulasnella sp. 418]|nr:hypothetical protein FRC02_004685 [Tulasnella sp. 418]
MGLAQFTSQTPFSNPLWGRGSNNNRPNSLTLFVYHQVHRLENLAESMPPSSAMPIGASRVVSEIVPTGVEPSSPGVLNSILALLPLPPQSPV